MTDKEKKSGRCTKTRRSVLKGSATAGLLGFGVGIGAAEDPPSSAGTGGERGGKPVKPHRSGGGFSTQDNLESGDGGGQLVLIVKDCNPWYAPANEAALREMDVPYVVINSGMLSDEDLGSYTAVVLPSTQHSTYYHRLAANRDKLASYVEDGGTLVAHATDSGYPCAGTWSTSFLPGGVGHVTDYFDNLSPVERSSPILENVSPGQLDGWNYSSHGYLTDLPASATVVAGVAGSPTDRPTYVDYGYGDGRVLATTQTLEWPWYSGAGTRAILRNELRSAVTGTAPGSGGRFETVRNAKLDVASRIDTVSATISEQGRVEATLTDLKQDLDDGALDPSVAVEAVERMKAGERVTETFLAGVGPQDTSEFDTAGNIVDLGINVFVELFLGAVAIGRLAKFSGWGRVGSKLGSARTKFVSTLDDAIEVLVGSVDDLAGPIKRYADEIASFLEELIISGGITTGSILAAELSSKISGVRTELANGLVGFFERDVPGESVDEKLETLDGRLGPEGGGPELPGSIDEAQAAAETAVEDVSGRLTEARGDLDAFKLALNIVSFLGVVGSALVATGVFSIAGITVDLIFLILGISGSLLGAAVGVDAIFTAKAIHDDGIDGVLAGELEV